MTARDKSPNNPTSPPLERYAFLLMAPEGAPQVELVTLDHRWKSNQFPSGTQAVYGRAPLRSAKPLGAALTSALRRELFRRRTRRGTMRLVRSQRLDPPPGRSGRLSGRVRDWLLGGAVFQFSSDENNKTLLDIVVEAAGAVDTPGRFHAPGDGGAVARIRTRDGEEVILRAAVAGESADPGRLADGLEYLERKGLGRIPRVTGRGVDEGISWITESLVHGVEPQEMDDDLLAQVIAFCTALPVTDGSPEAPTEELALVGRAFPQWADTIARVGVRIAPKLGRLPGVTRHGDLWSGNLLVQEGQLTGVIDWAAWHPSAAPGTDLLHLRAAQRKRGADVELGEVWHDPPWEDSKWLSLTAGYWTALGIEPNEETLEAISVAWWASWVAQSLARHPGRATQPHWVEGNVDSVMEAIE